MPGCKPRLRGSDSEVEFPFANPGDIDIDDDDDVSTAWRSCGLVEDVYCPGKSSIFEERPGADIVAPAITLISILYAL